VIVILTVYNHVMYVLKGLVATMLQQCYSCTPY
jgi:hypothetical protein